MFGIVLASLLRKRHKPSVDEESLTTPETRVRVDKIEIGKVDRMEVTQNIYVKEISSGLCNACHGTGVTQDGHNMLCSKCLGSGKYA